MSKEIYSSYEDCPTCGGTGLMINTFSGEPDCCWECKGDSVVRRRDERGRFSRIIYESDIND